MNNTLNCSIFNNSILKECKDDSHPYVAIIFCIIMLFCCIYGCILNCKHPIILPRVVPQ